MAVGSTTTLPSWRAQLAPAAAASRWRGWWRGCLLALLVGGSGAWVRGCHLEPDCGDDPSVAEGTRFRVEVLSAPENSEACSFISIDAGDVLTMTAGPMGTKQDPNGSECRSPTMGGLPEGLPDNLELEACLFVSRFAMTCEVVFPDCNQERPGGKFSLQLQQHMPKASEGSVIRDMLVSARAYGDCADKWGGCQLVYQVAVERLAEE